MKKKIIYNNKEIAKMILWANQQCSPHRLLTDEGQSFVKGLNQAEFETTFYTKQEYDRVVKERDEYLDLLMLLQNKGFIEFDGWQIPINDYSPWYKFWSKK